MFKSACDWQPLHFSHQMGLSWGNVVIKIQKKIKTLSISACWRFSLKALHQGISAGILLITRWTSRVARCVAHQLPFSPARWIPSRFPKMISFSHLVFALTPRSSILTLVSWKTVSSLLPNHWLSFSLWLQSIRMTGFTTIISISGFTRDNTSCFSVDIFSSKAAVGLSTGAFEISFTPHSKTGAWMDSDNLSLSRYLSRL